MRMVPVGVESMRPQFDAHIEKWRGLLLPPRETEDPHSAWYGVHPQLAREVLGRTVPHVFAQLSRPLTDERIPAEMRRKTASAFTSNLRFEFFEPSIPEFLAFSDLYHELRAALTCFKTVPPQEKCAQNILMLAVLLSDDVDNNQVEGWALARGIEILAEYDILVERYATGVHSSQVYLN